MNSSCSVNKSFVEPENETSQQQQLTQQSVTFQEEDYKNTSTGNQTNSSFGDTNHSTATANDHQNVHLNNPHEISIATTATTSSLLIDNDSYESADTVNTGFTQDDENDENNLSNREIANSSSSNTNIDDLLLNSVGYVKPYWIPDKEAPNCMFCGTKFNLIVRRHHCRACGKVACSLCCHYYIKLPYLGFKEGRICKVCVNLLDCFEDGEIDSRRSSRTNSIFNQQPNQNTSSILDLSVATSSVSTMGAIIPTTSQIRPVDENSSNSPIQLPVGVLKKPDRIKDQQQQTNKQVIFSDGIRPGSDLTESHQSTSNHSKTSNSSNISNFPSLSTFSTLLFPSNSRSSNVSNGGSSSSLKSSQMDQQQQVNLTNNSKKSISSLSSKSKKDNSITTILQDLNGALPPLINKTPLMPESTFADILSYLNLDEKNYLRFQITKNLCINVNRAKLDCCSQLTCWIFASDGLSSFGQDEILILLESLDAEVYFPRDVLRTFLHVYDNAFKGEPLSDNNLMLFEDSLFESKENCGFLFFRHSLQCLNKIQVPQSPYLIGLLIKKYESCWAKILPIRLLLRLGAQSNCFPCPIVSQWSRKSTFLEIGHTIMNVLAVIQIHFLFLLF